MFHGLEVPLTSHNREHISCYKTRAKMNSLVYSLCFRKRFSKNANEYGNV